VDFKNLQLDDYSASGLKNLSASAIRYPYRHKNSINAISTVVLKRPKFGWPYERSLLLLEKSAAEFATYSAGDAAFLPWPDKNQVVPVADIR
jgi:hypothetical protein